MKYLLYKEGSSISYAASIAATWVWAPALYVASEQGWANGIAGLLTFTVPNALTLIIFGCLVSSLRRRMDGVTLGDVIRTCGTQQYVLHVGVSLILLMCSTCVQLLGLYTILSTWFGWSKLSSTLAVGALVLPYTLSGGIRTCIRTDLWKYAVILCGGLILAASFDVKDNLSLIRSDVNTIDLWWNFGFVSAIGLIMAPYVDQTFWQRAFSIPKEKVMRVFTTSAFFFAAIPLIFGYIGIVNANQVGWNLTSSFTGVYGLLLGICVFAALLSTLDSNLCAVASYAAHDFQLARMSENSRAVVAMLLLFILSSALFCAISITITELFLIYGTIRTCIGIPTILIITRSYDRMRLFLATCIAVVISPLGYLLASPHGWGWCFTLFGCLFPMLGYSRRISHE